MEEASEGVSSGPYKVLVDVADKKVDDILVDALTTTTPTTTSTTVSDANKTSNVLNDDENDFSMAEGKCNHC